MIYVVGLGILFSVIRLTYCIYDPWEDIKRLYKNIPYDKVGAEIRQAELEKSCLELTNGNENVCYDDCILRQHYGVLSLIEGGGYLGAATFEVEDKLEDTVLNVAKDGVSIYDNPIKQNFRSLFRPCVWESPTVDIRHSVSERSKSLEEAEIKLCVKYLTDKEKAELSITVECVKKNVAVVFV